MRREWTTDEEDYLERWYDKKGVPFIAKKLNRTKDSIKRKAQNMGLNAYAGEKLYVRSIAKCFNCDSRVINRWISNYGLPYSKVIRGQATCQLIEQKEFWIWAKENENLIPWNKYNQGTILPEPEWVKEKIRSYSYKNNRTPISDYDILNVASLKRRGYSFSQIAKEIGRTEESVKHIWKKIKINQNIKEKE